MTTARCHPVRRFLSTDVVHKGETIASAVSNNVAQNGATESILKKQPPRQRRKNNKKKEKVNFKQLNEQKQDMAAAVVASEEKMEDSSAKKGGKEDAKVSKETVDLKGKKKQKTLTRLVDNHPLTEDDLDPHKFLLHLTEDKLDPYPPTPVFGEGMEDKLPTVHRVIGKDANGNEVTIEERLPPKNEQEMNKDGFFYTNDRMYGYTSKTPLFYHTDLTQKELDDEDIYESLQMRESLMGMNDMEYDDEEDGEGEGDEGEIEEIDAHEMENEDDIENELELDPAASGNLSDDPNQGESSSNIDGLLEMRQLGDWIEGSALHPGSDIQLDLELEMLARSVEDRRVRREYLQLERGYDNREFDNVSPWVDTHRIEAIDSRLRELHRMREAGELDYPIEKNAAEEARRIKKEHQLVLRSLNRALHSSKKERSSELASDDYLYSAAPKQTKHRRELFPRAAKEVDASLDSMDVYSIPLEKLYQARRQELDKLRETAYEDFDLDYLLAKSGKAFPSRGNASSLYEYRHGHTESTRLPSAQEQAEQIAHFDHVPSSLSPSARASLGRDVLLFDRLRNLSSKEAAGLYSGKVRMITPEMEAAEEKEEKKKKEEEEEDAALSSALFEQEEPKELEENFDRTIDSLTKEERVDAVDPKYTVDSEMDTLLRDPKKPLEDYEMALTKDGDVKFAWRTNRQEVADFSRDKKRFMKQFEDLVNHTEVKPEEEAMLKNTVITSEDMAAARRAVGQPNDVSDEVFAKRYLSDWKAKAEDAELVTNLLSGYSMEHPEKMLKDLGLDSEEGIERYLMGTFESHEAPEDQLLPEELLQARETRLKAEKVIEQLQKQVDDAEKAKQNQAAKTEGETAKTEGETVKTEGETTSTEGEVATKEAETIKTEGETTKTEGETTKTEDQNANKESEAAASESGPFKTTFETMDEPVVSSTPTNLSEAFSRLMERFEADGEEAVSVLPDEETDVIGEGHIVDALEYSDQVYVHEKDRQMMYAMYQRGVSPREISKSFGFDERRVYAILRLMQDRPRHQKEGTFAAERVDAMEEKESPWNYDYRDFPPQSYRHDDSRKAGKVPAYLPKFVFLKEGEDERKIMKEVEAIVNRQKREKEPRIQRKGIPLGESRQRTRKNITCRVASRWIDAAHVQNRVYGHFEGSK